MAIIKCKMCGGDIIWNGDKTLGTCDSCGSTMTFPKITDDRRTAAFNRGNSFRRSGKFDKALEVYEHIISEDDTDAEAHWCCAISRFGVEYVEDPTSYDYLPTLHRLSYDSFLQDVDYLAALRYSDGVTKRQYQKDAAKIAEVQKGTLAATQNAEPFDVFICYKEEDEAGRRTRDSQMAQDVYYQLTDQGFHVFFARITLEDVAGAQYEPYIFAALNSAKVMIVIGTEAEHFNAVWVKNEWSRYLALMKHDRDKVMLPCYRDMDPYDLPEELSVLQSYDMSRIGFIQDLIRGVKKVLAGDKPVSEREPAGGMNPLIERAFIFLEDRKWQDADEYCERALDQEPKNGLAYLGKLMVSLNASQRQDLGELEFPFDNNEHYQKIVRFGDAKLKAEMKGYLDGIARKIEEKRLEEIYRAAEALMCAAKREADYQEAANAFERCGSFWDAEEQVRKCQDGAEGCRKDDIYFEAVTMANSNDIHGWESALQLLQTIPDWRDASRLADEYLYLINDKKRKNRMAAEKRKKYTWGVIIVISVIIMYALLVAQIKGSADGKQAAENAVAASETRTTRSDVGDTVTFGNYAGEPIEWLVLEENADERIVISVKGLDTVQFNKSQSDENSWELSYVRDWLNGTFYKEAFSNTEQEQLTEGVTGDKVYLLSFDEAKAYFANEDQRICYPTQHAKDNGAKLNDAGACCWWLRSSKCYELGGFSFGAYSVECVYSDGYFGYMGLKGNNEYACVRPVIVQRI